MILPVIDTHAHLFLREFDGDREEVVARARAASVDTIVNIGIDPDTSRAAVDLARSHPGLFASAGLHPSTVWADLERALEEIRDLARAEPSRVVAIGEIGLDYHWKDVSPADQEPRLLRQIDLALELDLPVIIHCRNAIPDLFRLLEALPRRPAGVLHCFAGGPEDARRAQSLGFHISFAGNITYRKAQALRDAALAVAPERLLLETDSPYLPPEDEKGKRKRRNEPAFVAITRDALAALHGTTPERLAAIADANARRLFRLPS
jgi:TatD DNase family protein